MPIHVQQRPKKRTRANPGQHRFLDLQAVEDDEDSEEEGGGWDNLVGENEAFVVDDRDLIEDTGEKWSRSQHARPIHTLDDDGDDSELGGVNIKKPKPFKYHEFSLPPNTDHDWELWEVPVNVGSEAAVVFEIMHRVLRLVELTKTGKSRPCTKPPRSTFAPLCMQGRILVEAWEWNDVVGICNGIPGVRWWEIRRIPFIDGVALLNRRLPPFSVAPGDWIHLKVAPYMNDLAFVLQTGLPRPKSAKLRRSCLEPSLEVKLRELDEKHTGDNLEVVVVPRLDYKPPSPQCKRARGPHSIPQPCLFDLKKAFAASGPLSVTEIPDPLHSTPNPPPSALALPTPIGAAPGPLFSSTSSSPPIRYCYHDLTFDASGFLLLSISPSQCHHVCIHPTIEQLQPFLPSLSIPPTSKLHTFHLASARELKEGDKVKVVGSTYADSIGIIKELTPTYAYLLLLDSLASAQIPRLFLRRYYKIGDRVTIKAGVDAGLTGYIIAVNDKDDTVVICNPLVTMTQVVTPIYYVEFAADGLRFGKPPPHGPFIIAKLVDMRDPTFAHLENLPIVVTKGPLKGCSGVVKSVAITGIASIEMNVLSTQVNQLQWMKVQNLVFELEANEYYQVNEGSLLEYTARYIPNLCSLLAPRKEEDRPRTPEHDPLEIIESASDHCWAPDVVNPGISHDLGSRPLIPDNYWLIKLPHLKTFGCLRVTISSYSAFEDGTWDNHTGLFKGIDGEEIRVFIPPPISKVLLIPFRHIIPTRPHRKGQLVHCLEPNQFWGRRKKAKHDNAVQFKLGQSEGQILIGRSSRKTNDNSLQQQHNEMGNPELAETIVSGESQAEPSRKQTMSTKLEIFTPEVLRVIQEEIIALENGADHNGACSGCLGQSSQTDDSEDRRPLYRCLECFYSIPVCRTCIKAQHINHPFHHIQRWTGTYFERSSLHALNFVIHLGHNGEPCPLNKNPPMECVVVHTNGIHQRWILQLIRRQLFPPTLHKPRTMFTFAVLKDFHRHSLSAKTSAYDYYEALKRHTNATFPHHVQDRYLAMMLVMRVWRYLALHRWSGQDHNIDAILRLRWPGCLAVRCPACPEIGFNVDEDVLNNAPDFETHIYTLFVSADGNFRLQRKKKKDDPDDKALLNGHAYFVEQSAYKAHIKALETQKEASAYFEHSESSNLQIP
ncbi:Transcription elongation factor SPT5 [Leucoagaricus sp. SymC.cos]|nr:Transcription elongation factor SPT5 [Leucoagaricus sp. SymC.cos]